MHSKFSKMNHNIDNGILTKEKSRKPLSGDLVKNATCNILKNFQI